MPRQPNSQIKQDLIQRGFRVEPDMVRVIVQLLDRDESIYSITTGDAFKNVLHGEPISKTTVKKIKANIVALKKLFATYQSVDPVSNVSEEEHVKDMKEPFTHMEKALKEGGVDTLDESREDPFSVYRLVITEALEEKVPYEHWSLHHLNSIGLTTDKALAFLREFDEIYPHRVRAEVRGDNPRLAKFRSFERWLEMHYEVYLLGLAPGVPDPYLRSAIQLVVRGKLESNTTLVHAGHGIIRYAIWEGENNANEFYQSLRSLHRRKTAYERFVKSLKKMIQDEEEKNEE